MDGHLLITLLFLVGGLGLLASEVFFQAFVSLFLGLAALVVAGLRALGIVEGVFVSFALWGILSVALVLPLRPLLKKYFPPQQRYDPSDEDLDAYGQVVEVLPPADEGEVRGRIRFQGTTWPAACTDGSVPAGPKARLLHRDRLCWIVEPLPSLPEARIVPRPPEGND